MVWSTSARNEKKAQNKRLVCEPGWNNFEQLVTHWQVERE